MWPGSFIHWSLRNCMGLGPTRRWARSTMFRKGGTREVTVPKFFARLCSTAMSQARCIQTKRLCISWCILATGSLSESGSAEVQRSISGAHQGVFGRRAVVILLGAQVLDHLARVDLHGALDLAHAICCARLGALVLVHLLQLIQPATTLL